MILFFDTETTGLPPSKARWEVDYDSFPHIVQLSWIMGDKEEDHIIRPDGWKIPEESTLIHGISHERAMDEGEDMAEVLSMFVEDCVVAEMLVGFNIYFDTSVVKANILRTIGRNYYDCKADAALHKSKRYDLMFKTIKLVRARNSRGGAKFPSLVELYNCLFGESFPAHNALEDVKATIRCYNELNQQNYGKRTV